MRFAAAMAAILRASGNAAARVEVGLSEVDQVALQIGCKAVDGLHPFACRDRRRGMRPQMRPVFDVVHLQWLFDEEQVAVLDAAHEVQDVRSRHRAGTMNGQFVIGTAGLAQLMHVLDHLRDRSLRPSDAADGVAVGLGLLPGFGRDAAAAVVALDPVVDRARPGACRWAVPAPGQECPTRPYQSR